MKLNGSVFPGNMIWELFYILNPAILMIFMALMQIHLFPLLFERPWRLINVWTILSFVWVGFLSWRMRRLLRGRWFYFWGPIATVVSIIAVYLGASVSGFLHMGGHDDFPGAIIMLPTVGLLFCIAAGTAFGRIVSFIRKV